ncbi:CbtB domain-containing protein [Pseudaminobacter soli (ex Li et al. 2025)]|jgi:cobalt transporter subunit CbtB|uniref:Cobalt transporter subunit CbtB n=1 Tax=Pseudaminobacter soli (ex Li et al. 2025) TaxID=1295366 RepID=A0A2P7SMT0_9HYPH|nr:CbtB-domain containing protein [Mesorhizobium soli]PSJ63804.1 cobalt transporter subunit CbtB [Mesorhizobium soli]
MNTVSSTLGASASSASRATQLALSALLGLFVVGFVGFSHMDVVHNAAHDVRHSLAFPCH